MRIAKGARQLAGHGLQPGLRASAVEADEVLELDLRAGVALGDGRHAERSSGTRAAIELHDERPAEQRAPLDRRAGVGIQRSRGPVDLHHHGYAARGALAADAVDVAHLDSADAHRISRLESSGARELGADRLAVG